MGLQSLFSARVMNMSITFNKKNIFAISLFVFFYVFLCSHSEAKTFHIQILRQPEESHYWLYSTIVSANFDDPTPNYCYQRKNCYFAMFDIPRVWGENGEDKRGSQDTSSSEVRSEAAFSARTMGEVARNLRDRGLLHKELSTFWASYEKICLYAGFKHDRIVRQYAGTLASNCVDIAVVPTACTITPESLSFDWGTLTNTEVSAVELTQSLMVTCTQPTNARLSISGEIIPLNGDSTTFAEFNLGSGWTGSTNVSVKSSEVINMKSRLKGLDNRSGEYSGSAILLFEQI